MTTDGAYRTEKLDLAAVLSIARFECKLEKVDSATVQFVFSYTEDREEELYDVIEDFEEFKTKVEPRSFLREVSYLRRHVYQLAPRPQPAPVAPAV